MTAIDERVTEILKKPYSRVLIPEQDGRFSATVLEFRGCFSHGDNVQEAYANLEEAAQHWVRAALEQGLPIPEPPSETRFSGRFALRMPRSLHKRLTEIADREGVSVNQFIVGALSERVGEESAGWRYSSALGNVSWNELTLASRGSIYSSIYFDLSRSLFTAGATTHYQAGSIVLRTKAEEAGGEALISAVTLGEERDRKN